MAITHSVKFSASAKEALSEIQKYEDKIVATAQTVDKHAASLGGGKIIQQAHNWTAAVDKIGGATRLTGQEQAKVNAILEAAIAKYQALGQQAPSDMTKLYEATKKVGDSAAPVQSGLSGIMAKLGPMGPMVAGAFSLGAVTSFVSGVVGAADQIQKMADRTGDTAGRVQELQYIAGQTGASFDGLINAAQELQKRLGEGDEGVAKALKDLGLNAAEIGNMGATEALYAINTAMTSVGSETDRARIQSELFGKAWKDLAPAMRADMQALAEEAPKMADATVAALDKAGDRWDWLKGKVKVAGAEMLNFSFEMVRAATAADFWEKSESPIIRNVAATRSVAAAMLDASDRAYTMGTSYSEAERILAEMARTQDTKVVPAIRRTVEETTALFKATALTVPQFVVLNGVLTQVVKPAQDVAKTFEFMGWAIEGVNSELPAFVDLMPAVKGNLEDAGEAAEESTDYYKLTGDVLTGLGRAAEMAGHKTTAAVLAIAQTTIQAFAQGGPVAGAIAFVSAALTSFGDKLFKTEGKKVNDLRDDFIAAHGGLHALNVEAQAAGMTLDALLKAKTVKDYEKAIADLTAAFDTQNRKLEEQRDLRREIEGQIDGLTAEIAGLREKQIPAWSEMEGLMSKYGITLDQVGVKTQQLAITDQATTILSDFERLKQGGADVGGYIGAMGDEIAGLVLDAKKYGVELPENLKPLAEELLRQGKLVDENGVKLDDLGGVKFGAPVKTEAEKISLAIEGLVTKLGELIDKLGKLPKEAEDAAAGMVDSLGTAPWEDWPAPDFGDGAGPREVPQFAGGVRNFGGGLAIVGERGPELVSLPRGSSVYPNGSGGGTITINLTTTLDGRVVAQNQVRHIPAVLAAAGR
jgi:hypothetical protein